MSIKISQRELRNDSGRIMRAVADGTTFVITRNGEQIGELAPMRRPRFVRSEVLAEAFKGAPVVDYNRLREDLDAIADQDITPRA